MIMCWNFALRLIRFRDYQLMGRCVQEIPGMLLSLLQADA